MSSKATREHAAQTAPPCLYLLADHLDAALAAGEDLLATSEPETKSQIGRLSARRQTLDKIRTYEMHIIARILKARERAAELVSTETLFQPLSKLFISGTAVLVDAVEECGDATDLDFESGDCMTHYARTRALIPNDAPGCSNGKRLKPEETFRVAARIELGALLDLTARFLDVLDVHYELYPDTDDGKAAA